MQREARSEGKKTPTPRTASNNTNLLQESLYVKLGTWGWGADLWEWGGVDLFFDLTVMLKTDLLVGRIMRNMKNKL